MNPEPLPGAVRPSPLRRTRLLLALERPDIVVIVIYGVALGLLSLAVPIAVQSLVNSVAFGSLIQPLVVLTVLLALALTGAAVLRALQVRIAEMLQRRLFVRIVTEIGGRLPRVSAKALEAAKGPELLNRFFDVFTTQKSVASLLLGGVDALLIALVGMIVLAFYHPALLAFDIVLIIGAVVVLIPLGRGGTGTSVAESKAKYAVAGWLEEMARHPLSFKLAGGERFAQERVEALARSYLDKRHRHFRVVFRQLIGALTIEVVASVALLAIGGLLVIGRQLSLGQLVAAELIVTAVVASIAKLGGKVETFYDLVAAVDKLGEMLDLPMERSDGAAPSASSEARGQLEFRNVEPPTQDGGVPMHLSFELRRGERLAIHGAPEHVTSSIADAAFGLVAPVSGVIEVDGHDTRDLSLEGLRSRVAVVRGTEVLPCAIAENLRPGNVELPAEEAWKVLQRVGLDDEIKSLPEGLGTLVTMGGAPLSRSQAIQLTIARALAARPSVLVLDRTLDQLDPTERSRVVERLFTAPDVSLVLITEDTVLRRQSDRDIDLSSATSSHGEACVSDPVVRSTHWSRFERTTLPERLSVQSPQNVALVAKLLVSGFVAFSIAALLAPWVQNIQGSGRVIAYAPEQRQQNIEATVSGTIAQWYVQEGSQVEKGDPIVLLADNDDRILDRLGVQRAAVEMRRTAEASRVESLRSRVASLERYQLAEINGAEAQVAIAQQDLASVQQEVTAAEAELETNELNLRRQRDLRQEGLASQREYELAELAARQSRAKLASTNARERAAKNRLAQSRAALRRVTASARAEIENAEASLRSAETQVASASEGLAKLDVDIARQQAQTILAPIDGTIMRVVGRLGGQQVSQGQLLALLVPRTEDRAVELYVDGNDAALVKPGSPVRLQFEGWPAVQFSGWPSVAVGTFGGEVAFVDAADDGRGNFRIVVVPDGNPEEPWPAASYLRQGVLTKGWILLNRVRLGFEVWRQFNGFPPTTDPPPMANTPEDAK